MAPKGNNMVPNGHFHKDWQLRIRTHFDQAQKKVRRRRLRRRKARRCAPRPAAGPLRPVVHCPTFRYHTKLRLGRGFNLAELKAAKISSRFAQSIGIAVDFRRRNRSLESLQANVERLKSYRSRLVLFPLNPGRVKRGEATADRCLRATQWKGPVMKAQLEPPAAPKACVITKRMRKFNAFACLRKARMDAYLAGKRAKRARESNENVDDITKEFKKAIKR